MKIYIGTYLLWIFLGICLGFLLCLLYIKFSESQFATKIVSQDRSYPHVRPLIVPWDSGLQKTQELIPFRKSIENVIQDYKKNKKADEIAYYFRDLNNGPWFGVNEDTQFRVASLFKVPTLLSYYRWAEENPDILNEEITYDGSTSNKIDLNPLTKSNEKLVKGKKYTIQDLLDRMIIHSDNEAFRMLIEHADNGLIADPYNIIEMEINSAGDDFTATLGEFSPFFRTLYNASYLNREYSEKALQLLIKSEYSRGIIAGVPNSTEVAHKFAIRELENGKKQLHECGIVYHHKFPYTICIMTQGNDILTLTNILKDLSKLTYDQVNAQ